MKKFILAILLTLTATISLYAQDEDLLKAFAGDWAVYVVIEGNKNFMHPYLYQFDQKGTWKMVQNGKEMRLGSVKVFENKFVLIPEKAKHGIISTSLSQKRIEFRNEMQQHIFLCCEKVEDRKKILTPEQILKTWKIVQVLHGTGQKKNAPFTVTFLKDGSYNVTAGDEKNETDSGTWQIRDGLLYLTNRNTKPETLWYKAVFFADQDKLILNRMDTYCYAE